MAKDKKSSKVAAAAPVAKPAKSEKVKAGRVTKPAETPKTVAKATAKNTAKTVEKASKKSKKAKKEPTPEPSSEEDTSESSASSEEGSDDEPAPVKAVPKANGSAKLAAKEDESSDEEDSSDDDEEVEAPKKAAAPKTNGAVNGKAKVEKDNDTSDASSDDDDADDASSSDDEAPAKAGAEKLVKETKKQEVESPDASSDESDDDEEAEKAAAKIKPTGEAEDEDDDDEDESDDSDDDEEEEEVKPAPKVEVNAGKKRKAESEPEQTTKRSKVMIDGQAKEPTANLFCGQLSWSIDEEWLTREFEEFGELKGVRIITDRDTGRSKGFGYIEFANVDDAVKAVEAKNGTELDGRNLRLDFSEGRQQKPQGDQTPQQRSASRAQQYGDAPKEPTPTLWVGNISFEADESMVSELFGEYGNIKAVRLPTDRETGAPKGFGYVEMDSIDEAKAAFEALQGAELGGRPVRLDYAGAKPQNDSPGGRGGFGGRGGGRGGRGGFGDRGGRGGGRGRGGFGDRGGRGGGRGGRGGSSFNRGGFGDFSGKKTTF